MSGHSSSDLYKHVSQRMLGYPDSLMDVTETEENHNTHLLLLSSVEYWQLEVMSRMTKKSTIY